MAQSTRRKGTNTNDVKHLLLAGAVAATIAGWGVWASQDAASDLTTTPSRDNVSAPAVEQPVSRRVVPNTTTRTLPTPVTVTGSSR